MQVKIDDSAVSAKFQDILHSWDRYIIAYGSRGSGKTDTFYLKYLLETFQPFYFKLAFINKEFSGIRDAQYAGFKRVAKRVGLDSFFKFYDGDYRIVNTVTGNSMIPKGMDDPEKTKGLDDVTTIWWDEINKGTKEDYLALNELLRSPEAKYLQFAISFNPVSENHWLRSHFFSEDNGHKLNEMYKGQALLSHSTYRDNEFIDTEAYLQTLLMGAGGDQNRIKVNVHGEWGNEENKAPWLYAFDRAKFAKKKLLFYPSYPVYLSFDFNREPLTCTATQMSPHKGQKSSFIHHLKQFKDDVQLTELCQRIKAEYPSSILYVTGDASGNKGDVAFVGRHSTYYTMIKAALNLTDKQMNLNTRNMEHNDSRLLCNTMLNQYPNIYFSEEGCPDLIMDCEIAEVDEKSSKPGHLKKDRDKFKLDLFDGWRYFYQTYFNEFVQSVYFKVK